MALVLHPCQPNGGSILGETVAEIAEKTYYRSSLGLKKDVAPARDADYSSALIDGLRTRQGHLPIPEAGLTIHLARDFGFCYGVDKAIDMAYETRLKFPDRRIFLLTEIIHNPRVNHRMVEMGIIFLSGQYASPEHTLDDITSSDVVMIPAFGVASSLFKQLRERGCIVVDTTCGSVVHVWKRVERYAKDGFTSLVHGKFYHEETIATVSQATAQGGHFLVVRDIPEARKVCAFIEGGLSPAELMADFQPGAFSEGFDPELHLLRVGVANQTTMLASESLEIARMIGASLEQRHGAEHASEHFRSFDTICSATQDRQDAIVTLLAEQKLDLALVIGGYNSSNTGHLLAVALEKCPAYHIADASEIVSANELRHQPRMSKETVVKSGWLPVGEIAVGLTAGASTPNKAIADTIARLLEVRGCDPGAALRALDIPA
jgi:4-hydroxy-3-methylbut-2-enyl diphosphate reductase